MPDKTATRQLILEAVVACIEKYGIDKVTTRKIADEAGANIASINYYFRSKDELVAEALSMTIRHMMEDVFLAIDDAQRPFDEVLQDVLFYMLDGSRQFPGISRAHLYRAVVQGDRTSISSQAMVKVFEKLAQRAAREHPARDPRQVRLVLSQVMCSVMFSMLTHNFFPLPREFQLTGPKNARTLADFYARQFRCGVDAIRQGAQK